jgi:formylglycine-generating enzyme required for sulfatase activity
MKKKSLLVICLISFIGIFAYQSFDLTTFDLEADFTTQRCLDEQAGMVLIKGGTFAMGAGAVYPEETPTIKAHVDSFYMSPHEVTNREFAEFVDATAYVTVAERIPNPADYPHIPPEQLKSGSAVFVKLSQAVEAKTFMNWWHFIEDANWRQPAGIDSNIEGKDHYPVIHIAYEDAVSFANWKGHRLPTEAEYEYASRGGLDGEKFASGGSLTQNGKHVANTWQGLFPFNDTAEDGYLGLAPVGCYPKNSYGLHDMIGNVWEWTQTAYYPRHFEVGNTPTNIPKTGYDNNQPGVPVGVIKGGSYLCAVDFCMRYRPAARQAQDTGLGTSHIGFRTVKDLL